MAASILSQDLLAICLLLSKGDTRTKLEEIVRAAESYQESYDRHFGISRGDFRTLLWKTLYFELSLSKELDEVELGEVIPGILGFSYAHFNDGGECMIDSNESLDPDESEILDAEYWYGYSEKAYRNRIQTKRNMKAFFTKPQNPTPRQVIEFLSQHGIDKHLLDHCSRQGESS